MQRHTCWLATSALLVLGTFAVPAQAQRFVPEIEVLGPGRDGVLWLDDHISNAYLRSLDRRKPRKARAELRRRYAQDQPRPPEDVGRSESPRIEAPPGDPSKADDASVKLRDEVQRLSSETAKMRSETDALRESVGKLTSETNGLRGEIGALREELAKRAADQAITGKLAEPPRPSQPLRKQDSLKTDSPKSADEKFAERPATDSDGIRKQDERFTDTIARAWRRVKEMVGRPGQ